MRRSVGVVGSGAWGTALAVHLSARFDVRHWIRESDLVLEILERRENAVFLPGVQVPEEVVPTSELGEALPGVSFVVAAVPAQFARSVYRRMAEHMPRDVPVLVVTKGIEEATQALPLQVIGDELGGERPRAVLSGPSFAPELARGAPTAAVVASEWPDLAARLQRDVSSSILRLYTNSDPTGVQLAGALKNVVAISTGLADGLGMGPNAIAALITRGLAEISRLGRRLGGRPSTFSGLAGLGDLVLTCTSGLSRNREVGRRLAAGESLAEVQAASHSVAEGVRTACSARALAREVGVSMPIVEEVYRILFEGSPAEDSLGRLMGRPLTSEDEPVEERA